MPLQISTIQQDSVVVHLRREPEPHPHQARLQFEEKETSNSCVICHFQGSSTNDDILKVMENYKRSTADSASIRNRDQDEDVDADLLLPREGERMDNRHPR